ncbi:MAG: prepilin-type N-terminal cleavage/methylation domain-containing protein [Chitinivibrionales bacterium]|nr:prepilin-type N-terminal cleavage/methylation domain-containing protein [Chitinivibrionales bacterium]
MQPRHDHGFTLLELLVVVAVVGIIAVIATGTNGLRQFINEKKVERDVILFRKEIGSIKAMALKIDRWHFMTLNSSDNTYTIQRDNDGNGVADINLATPFPAMITFGFSTPAPAVGPDNVPVNSAKKIDGDWEINSIRVDPKGIAPINNGRLFLKNPNIPRIGYCIIVRSTSQMVKLFKWDGAKWREM